MQSVNPHVGTDKYDETGQCLPAREERASCSRSLLCALSKIAWSDDPYREVVRFRHDTELQYNAPTYKSQR